MSSHSSLLESARSFRDIFTEKYNIVTVTQVVLTFALAVLNWTVIRWWANLNLSQGQSWTANPISYLGLALIFFWAFGLAYLGSIFMPVRVLITPLDIEAFTWGIFTYYFWNSTPPSWGDALIFGVEVALVGLVFYMVGRVQNALYVKMTGIVGTSEDLYMLVLESSLPRDKVANTLWLNARQVLGLYHRRNLEDGTAAYFGRHDDIEFYIGITPRLDEKRNEMGCYLTVLAYVRARHAIWKSHPSEMFHKALCDNLKGVYLGGCNVTDSVMSNFSQALVDEALETTGGWGERLYEGGGALYRPLLLIGITAIATAYARLNNIIDTNTAVFIFVTIVLTQVAPSIYSRRKRIK